MGWRGIKDQELLALTEAHLFDVFITADQNLPYQQSLRDRPFRVIVISSKEYSPRLFVTLAHSCLQRTTLFNAWFHHSNQ